MLHVNAATLRGLPSPCTNRELSLPGCFVQHWCMQQKVHLLNVNNIGMDMGEEIYSNTLFNRL